MKNVCEVCVCVSVCVTLSECCRGPQVGGKCNWKSGGSLYTWCPWGSGVWRRTAWTTSLATQSPGQVWSSIQDPKNLNKEPGKCNNPVGEAWVNSNNLKIKNGWWCKHPVNLKNFPPITDEMASHVPFSALTWHTDKSGFWFCTVRIQHYGDEHQAGRLFYQVLSMLWE